MVIQFQSMLISVLYSHQTKTWKVADFGLTKETLTNAAHTTMYGQGTLSYRASELLSDDRKYTYHVDIWALGCILYELCTNKRAFVDDMAVWRLDVIRVDVGHLDLFATTDS